ncbi:hypothetical protein PV387_36770 [Streptomyces sp. ME02-6987-2C]|uniref:DUF6924 domain-containing protein n=1 Tax=unclassified Streptomyces TaxID=2593676 RepID=UPI0029BAB135|nr:MULTISPECIES: hypothetical protein [unclassified Streptomyces]MDX3371492.1 hypothetical protein [Streptomyces sp. ME02-6987-2C]MDX3427121.1 hypothetical protein [Streptomyces sp. ME02-6985-2c]
MKGLPQTENVLLIRTDFTERAAWGILHAMITKPCFRPQLHLVNDRAYRELAPLEASSLAPTSKFLLIADKTTLSTPSLQLLAVFPSQCNDGGIRVAVEDAWTIENNLAHANLVWGI